MNKFSYILIFLLLTCNITPKVDGVKQSQNPKGKIILGSLENRDIRYMPYTPENMRDMLKFEFLEAGFEASKLDMNEHFAESSKSVTQPENEIGTEKIGELPIRFKDAAGENFFPSSKSYNPILNSKQIIELFNKNEFEYFLQGSVSMHNDGKIVEPKDSNLFFLDIYDSKGKQIGMISFIVEERNLYEASLLKNTCKSVVKTFQMKIKGVN